MKIEQNLWNGYWEIPLKKSIWMQTYIFNNIFWKPAILSFNQICESNIRKSLFMATCETRLYYGSAWLNMGISEQFIAEVSFAGTLTNGLWETEKRPHVNGPV
jgi:hypothetical protein